MERPEDFHQITDQQDSNSQFVLVDVRDDDFEGGKIKSSIQIPSELILQSGFSPTFLHRFENLKI